MRAEKSKRQNVGEQEAHNRPYILHFARCAPRRGGFTLIEVIIAIALLMALVAVMFTMYHRMVATKQRIAEQTDSQRAAMLIIDRLENALTTTMVGDSEFGPGIDGTSSEIKVLMRSSAIQFAEQPTSTQLALGDLQRMEMVVDQSAGTARGRKTPVMSGSTMNVQEQFYELGRPGRVRFRYFDGSDWQNAFNSLKRGQLPLAIEVAVWYDTSPFDELEGNEEAELASADIDAPENFMADVRNSGREDEAMSLQNESMFAAEELAELEASLPPDRVRVIAIPDAAAPADIDDDDEEGES